MFKIFREKDEQTVDIVILQKENACSAADVKL